MLENLIYLLIILNIQIKLSLQLTVEQEQNVPVFQPFPSEIIDPLSICQEGLTNSIATFSLKDKNYVAISLTLCGIYIYDITDIAKPIVVFSDYLDKSGKTIGITTSHQNKYVWATHSTGNYFGINIEQIPFKIVVKGTSNQNLLIIKLVPWPNNEDILFLACNNQFQVFDWRDKQNGLKFMKSVDVQAVNCKKIKFIRNNQYALVTTPLRGIQFYIVNNGDNIDKMTFKYSCVLKPTFFDVNDFKVIDDNTIAVMMIYTGVYMHSMKSFFDNNGQNCKQEMFPLLSQTPIQGQGGNLFLSLDRKYLYAQFRTVGIKIYDVSQNTLQITQEIKVIQNCKDIILNDKEDFIFYTNSQSLQIFQRTKPNFNRELPNLLLNTYQMQQFNWFKESSSGSYDFDCVWREDLKSVFVSRSANGIMIFKYSGSGVLEETNSIYRAQSSYSVPQINFLPDGVTGYLPRFTNGFSIVDFSNTESPIILKEKVTMNSSIVQFGFFRIFKTKKLGVVANLVNALIFSIEDPLNPIIVGTIDTMGYTLGEVSLHSISLNKNEDIAFCVISTYGVIMVDISTPSKPQLLSKYFTDGASDLKLTASEKYVIISANYNGIIIAEITKNKQLVYVSKAQLNGNCFRILQFEGDQFILVTSYEDPMISLVSISDIKNPRVIQKIGNKRIVGYYQMCINQDKSELFVSGQYFLFHLNIKTSLILHTQMYLLISKENTNEYTRQNLEQGTSLKIGQRIELHLVPIYQTQDIIVRKAFYYDEFVLQELPSWMTFFPSEQILRLNVAKDSLKRNDAGDFIETVSQVVFLTYQSLSKSAFINAYLNITNITESTSIYNACQKEGYLDTQGFIQETYSPSKEFNLGANENTYLAKWLEKKDLVKQFIQYILNLNIVNYTTQLKITHSLIVDLNKYEQYIQTLEESVTIKMIVYEIISDTETIQSNIAKFVKKNYSGVLVLISDKQDEIQLEGSLKNINQVLKGGIKFFLDEETINPDKINVQITVSDYVNYNFEKILSYKKIPFLSKQSLISISTIQNLQSDLSSKYQNGEIYIQESFSYQISSDIFISKDESFLSYNAKLKVGDKFEEIPKDYWLQFSSTDRVFTGIPLPSRFNEEIYLQVNATDGYSYQIDQLKIIPNKIPFSYAIQLAIQILGPIIGLLGLYKYKHIIYNIFFKEQYVYTKDIAYVGENYRKQIVITDNQGPVALKLWKFFLVKVGAENIKYQLNCEIQKQGQANNFQYISEDLEQSNYSNKNNQSLFQDEIIKKIYPFGIHQEDVNIVDKKLQNVLMFNSQNIEDSKLIGKSQVYNNDTVIEKSSVQFEKNQSYLDKSQIQISSPKGIQALKQSTQTYNAKLKSTIQTISKSMNFSKSQKTRSNSESLKQSTYQEPLFKSDGTINFPKIVKFIMDQQNLLPDNKKDVQELDLKQLEIPTSILSQALYCLVVEYLLNLCSTTKNIFDCLKKVAVCSYKEIDWYKAYVNIETQFNDVHINPYPIFTICEQTLNSALHEIFIQIDKQNKIKKKKQQRQISFSLALIKECLKAKAFGFSFQPQKYIQATRGESLHTYKYMIHSIKAFERNNSISCCYKLYEKLDLHYQQKGLTDNDKLPVWIQGIDLIHGTILFGGKPEKKDIGSIIIKIFNQDQYILRSFEIQILQKDCEQENQRSKQFSILNIAEKKDMNISFNDNIEYSMNETAQQIIQKKKPTEQNNKKPLCHKSSLKKVCSNIETINDPKVNTPQQDEILEDKLDMELQAQSPFDSPALMPQELLTSKQFRTYLKQESFQNDDQPPMSTTQREMISIDSPGRRILNKNKLNQPLQFDESIIILKD